MIPRFLNLSNRKKIKFEGFPSRPINELGRFGLKKGGPKTLFLLRHDFIEMKFHILTLRKLFVLTFLPKLFIVTHFLTFS